MAWTVETLDSVDAEIEALPPSLQARMIRLMEMVENIGLENLREPHVKHIDGKLWELRAKASEGIARTLRYHDWSSCRDPSHIRQEIAENAADCLGYCPRENETGDMMTKISELKKRLMSTPEFREEYAKADAEFTIIEALVRARTEANLSQAEVAKRIGSTQSAIARLEGGGVSPSLSTLRRYAEATGTKLHVELRT